MAMAKSAVTVLSIMALFGIAMSATYKVGDKDGWTIQGNPDYYEWAKDKTFRVGDTLVFKYNSAVHDVKQVSKEDFEACNGKSPIATYTTGEDSIILKKPGKTYFLCSFTGHCEMGQKLEINVEGSAASPEGATAAPDASSPASTPTASVEGGAASTAAPPSSESSSTTKLTTGLVSTAGLSLAAAFAL